MKDSAHNDFNPSICFIIDFLSAFIPTVIIALWGWLSGYHWYGFLMESITEYICITMSLSLAWLSKAYSNVKIGRARVVVVAIINIGITAVCAVLFVFLSWIGFSNMSAEQIHQRYNIIFGVLIVLILIVSALNWCIDKNSYQQQIDKDNELEKLKKLIHDKSNNEGKKDEAIAK